MFNNMKQLNEENLKVIELIRHKFCDSCDGKGSDVCYACPVDEITAAIDSLPEEFDA